MMMFFWIINFLASCATLAVEISDGTEDTTEMKLALSDTDASLSINTNEGFGEEDNDTAVFDSPHLSVQVDFGVADDDYNKGVNEEEEFNDNSDNEMNDIYLPLDPFTLHHPFLHPEVSEFEYSDWYFLFFTPANKSSSTTVDVSSSSSDVATLLSSKLSVASSMFSINSVDNYKSNSISANLTLMSHSIPSLHHNLCNLQNTAPIFWIRGAEFRLVQVFHDKNQHLYINNKQSETNPVDSLGLLVTLTLGGLGMFLLVLALTFVAAKTITKTELDRFSELQEVLVEQEEYVDVPDSNKDIFVIDDGDDCIGVPEAGKSPILTEMMNDKKGGKSSSSLSHLLHYSLYDSWANLLGNRFIKLST